MGQLTLQMCMLKNLVERKLKETAKQAKCDGYKSHEKEDEYREKVEIWREEKWHNENSYEDLEKRLIDKHIREGKR